MHTYVYLSIRVYTCIFTYMSVYTHITGILCILVINSNYSYYYYDGNYFYILTTLVRRSSF
jgi:hypothetical protein